MLVYIDNFLNKITMYRLLLYVLTILLIAAGIFSLFDLMPFSWLELLLSTSVLIAACYYSNKFFAKIVRVPVNIESVYITAMILALIITHTSDKGGLAFLVLVSVIAMASKYLINFRGKHIFNPAALAVVITFYTISQGASWWVGNIYMLPLIVIGGLLVVRKIQRFDLVLSFIAAYYITLIYNTPGINPVELIRITLQNSPILFFAFIMVTEPSTSPPIRSLRMIYGALVGFIFGTGFMYGEFFASPELALVLGNIFSFAVSNKARYRMVLKEKKEIAPQTYSFVFETNHKLLHRPGQYLEWTIDHKKPDTRGNRRYFTVASSPTENHVDLGIKFYDKPSTFKQALMAMNLGDEVFAGQLAGDFTLPADATKKLAFIAGGIGVTPFRSIMKYLADKNEKRDIVLFYAANSDTEFAYKDILEKAGARVIYKTERLTDEVIKKEVPDFLDRTFYISGPPGMVDVFKKILRQMGISRTRIKVDFFPGYA